MNDVSMKACPRCAEQVLPLARVCKHCGADFEALDRATNGFPMRRWLFLGAVAAFIVSGWDLSGGMPGSSRQTEGYALFYLSIALFVIGGLVARAQRKAGDTRSDSGFWGWTAGIGLVVLFAGLIGL